MNYNHLHYFHAVATSGSLVAAARDLGVAPSTVSEQLKSLEEALGHTLFERTPRGMRPTQSGYEVLHHTGVIFRATDRMMRRLGRRPARSTITVDVGVSTSVADVLAAEYYHSLFFDEQVIPRIRVAEGQDLLAQLISREIDVILTDRRPEVSAKKGMEVMVLGSPRMTFVGAPSLARRMNNFPGGLDGQPFLHYTPTSRMRLELDHYFAQNGITPKVVGEVDAAGIQLAAVERGLGFCAVPQACVADAVRAGSVQVVGRANLEDVRLYLCHMEGGPNPAVVRAIEVLRQTAQRLEDTAGQQAPAGGDGNGARPEPTPPQASPRS